MKRILIADDKPDVVNTFATSLHDKYVVDVVYHTRPIRRLHKENKYYAIISDKVFPAEVSGLRIMEAIRKQDGDLKVKLILITAFDDEDVRRQANELNASILIKPINIEELFHLLENNEH